MSSLTIQGCFYKKKNKNKNKSSVCSALYPPPTSLLKERSTRSHSNPFNKTGGTRLLNLSTNPSSLRLPLSTSVPPVHFITVCPVFPFYSFSPHTEIRSKPSAPVGQSVFSQSAVLCLLHTSLEQINAADK